MHQIFLTAATNPLKCVFILGDPGADSGGEGKSKRAEKYCAKKKLRTARRDPGDNVLPDQKRSPPFCLLIGEENTKVFWHQSEGKTVATVWKWSDRENGLL